MPSQTTFFLTPPPLSLRSRSHGLPTSTPTQRRSGPVMLTPVTTAAGLISISAVAVGGAVVLRPKLFPKKTEPATPEPPSSATPPSPPPANNNTAVIGLSQPNSPFTEPEGPGPLLPTPVLPNTSVPQLYMDSINPALFDFRDEMSIKQNKLSNDFSECAALLSELDSVKSVVVIDGDRDIIWVAGATISGNVSIPNMSKLIKEPGDVHVMSSKGEWTFMGEDVKEVGVVKMEGGMVVVGGDSEGFFSDMERRLTVAVANKLGTVLEVGKALGRV